MTTRAPAVLKRDSKSDDVIPQRGAEEGAEIDKWKCPAPSLCL